MEVRAMPTRNATCAVIGAGDYIGSAIAKRNGREDDSFFPIIYLTFIVHARRQ